MSPRTPEQFRAVRRESEQRVLRAALVVFARLGYEGATVRDIAREAGVSQGLMYNYFRSKEELLRAIFRAGARDVAASLDAAAPDATPEQRLETVIRSSFAIVREHLDFWTLSYALRMQRGVAAGLGKELAMWSESVRAQLEAHLRAAGHPKPALAARVLFAAIDGVAQHYALDPDNYPIAAVADELVARFCRPASAGVRKTVARRSKGGT